MMPPAPGLRACCDRRVGKLRKRECSKPSLLLRGGLNGCRPPHVDPLDPRSFMVVYSKPNEKPRRIYVAVAGSTICWRGEAFQIHGRHRRPSQKRNWRVCGGGARHVSATSYHARTTSTLGTSDMTDVVWNNTQRASLECNDPSRCIGGDVLDCCCAPQIECTT